MKKWNQVTMRMLSKMNNNDTFKTLSNRIVTSTNKESDRFVGVIFKDDKLSIITPLGFKFLVPKDNEEIKGFREDLKLFIDVIKKYYLIRNKDDENRDMEKVINSYGYDKRYKNFPIYSYDYLIQDYLNNGYYKEKEVVYKESNSGKINWNRTIKKEKSFFDGANLLFLKFIRRKTEVLNDELITLLHKTCVYESFDKWGFIYFDKNFSEKPKIKVEDALKYVPFLQDKIAKTFNDKSKELFIHMINIIEHDARFSNNIEYKYGVEYFHPVWELLIDKAFGIPEKEKYFPRAKWKHINNSDSAYDSSSLRPDTIMKRDYNNDSYELYVLDAKYYGLNDNGSNRLPATADINKQITYGKAVEIIDNKCEPYNAFLLPSDRDEKFYCDKYATIEELTDYKNKRFGKVLAIFCNTKHIMKYLYNKASDDDINKLSELIDVNISKINGIDKNVLEDVNKTEIEKATNTILVEINKVYGAKKSLAASIDLKMFEPIYKILDKLFKF